MISPTLIVYGVIALIRLARASDKALAQHARDQSIELPGIALPDFTKTDFITGLIREEEARVKKDPDLAPLWAIFLDREPSDPEYQQAAAVLFGEALAISARIKGNLPGIAASDGKGLGGAYLIEQWRAGKGPPDPLLTVALTVVDIGLEFVAREPSVLGLRKGEALIGAFAGSLAGLIEPEGDAKAFRNGFSQRLVRLFLGAALATLHENTEMLVSDADWRKLVQNTLKPVIEAFPPKNDDAGQFKVHQVADLLLGPVFKAAVDTVSESPAAFLGDAAVLGTLPGVVIGAILEQAKSAKRPLAESFSDEGLATFAKSVLAALAAHPGVMVSGAGAKEELARQVVASVLGTLAKEEWKGSIFSRDLGLKLAAAALTAVKEGTPALFRQDKPWEALAQNLLVEVVEGLVAAAGGTSKIQDMLGAETLEKLGRIFIEHAAKTPAMIAGTNEELRHIVAAVARAMAADANLLLGRDDWLSIAAVVSAEAAASPGRLFGVRIAAGGAWVGEAILTSLLAVASEEFERRKKTGDNLLFGPTLREILVHTVTTAAGNFAKLAEAKNTTAIETTLRKVLAVVDDNPQQFGARELLRAFKLSLPKALATGSAPALEKKEIEALLSWPGE